MMFIMKHYEFMTVTEIIFDLMVEEEYGKFFVSVDDQQILQEILRDAAHPADSSKSEVIKKMKSTM